MPDVLVQDSIARPGDTVAPAFVCSWTDGGLDAAWLHLGGELDIATAPQLEETLRQPQLQARLVVLDLRELEFIDCAGVHAIVNASIQARQVGRRLVLPRGIRNVDRVFTLAGGADDVKIADVDLGEPSARALMRLAEEDLAS
jgi:anti-anti-sigma factor